MATGDDARDQTAGQPFDRNMRAHMDRLRRQALSRRGFLRLAGGVAGAAALAGPLDGRAEAAPGPNGLGMRVLHQEGTSITFGLETEIHGVEPALNYDFATGPVVCEMTEGLMVFDAESQLAPLLAETFTQPDNLTYVYTLRQGVTFHDGAPVTPDDVIASLNRVTNPAVASPIAWMFDPVASIEQTDDKTVTIKLTSPSALFRYVAGTSAMHVMPKQLIDAAGDNLIVEPIGTGPYKFVRWDAGSLIEMEKNPTYWQTGKPYFDKVSFKIIVDGTTRVTGLKTGDLQLVRDVPPDQIAVVQSFPNVTWQETVGFTINTIIMRNDKAPFNDPKVRQAVSHAIDVESLMTNLVKEVGVRARATTVPPTMPGSASDQLEPVPFDVARAKQLLAESTVPDGFTTPLLVDENELRVAEAQAVQQMLKAINVTVEIAKVSQQDRITAFSTGDYDGMAFHEWGADFPDANGNLLPLFHSRNFPPQNNQANYSNPQVDKLLDDAEAEIDLEKRAGYLIEAQKLIAADMPVIWLDHFKWFLPTDSTLTGYQIHPLFYWTAVMRDLKPA